MDKKVLAEQLAKKKPKGKTGVSVIMMDQKGGKYDY